MRIMPRLPGYRRFAREVDLRLIILSYVVLVGIVAVVGFHRRGSDSAGGSASERLKPERLLRRAAWPVLIVPWDARRAGVLEKKRTRTSSNAARHRR
jgi:hypothetical protein